MKTYFYSLLSFLLILCSCEDYLENKDGDKVIPNTLKHYDELIYGEIIKQASGSEMAYLPLMTDDVEDKTVEYYDSDSARNISRITPGLSRTKEDCWKLKTLTTRGLSSITKF